MCDSVVTRKKAEKITSDIDKLIGKSSFIVKHWTISGDTAQDKKTIINSVNEETVGELSKVLGMMWDPKMDKLSFTTRLNFSKKVYMNVYKYYKSII